MKSRALRRTALLAGVATTAIVLAGCAGGADAGDSTEGDGPVTITVATFNDFGYAPFIEEFMKENPDIKVVEKISGGSDESRENMLNFLGQDSGLSDIEAVEVDWLSELMQYSDRFVDLTDPELEGRWIDWKQSQATDAEGRVIGYGTDIGPQGIAYRADLVEAAGLPSEREAFAEYLGGADATWDRYFEVGAEFVANSPTGATWFDTVQGVYMAQVNQLENAYEENDGTPIDLEGSDVEEIFTTILEHGTEGGQSAGVGQWTGDWDAYYNKDDGFATIMAPGWMLNIIKDRAGADFAGWDIADVLPGGGGNWGGAFLTVPTQSKHPEEAKKLAAYLTSPEVQLQLFLNQGTLPSTVEALASEELKGATDEWFNNAPVGQILSNRADAVTVVPYKGASYKKIHDVIVNGMNRVDVEKTQGIDESWDQVLSELGSLN
ncbi:MULTISPECIES: ABC transporter substrate-binding protein [unclassified Microbacterium]|uniref:ABC transporter substrate-binding protein n=1 Tax=unclassified Microbacterium TaxID=2609290 RepID=UPI00214CE66A|nr:MULTISPECIES: ABC transporter substrate-binding protein [unclassified Microbacterium]MCR2801987.1 ABC transporter substrate-binding protein [Microbacterium sp. zg.Y818]MCR2824705.1 ABC transporter substrate-binding protein [Microbacterium sp. zg.Y909]WIM22543.1 ABC transporter substrate-binding protein [Microbacterium sp. zg-Y818]